MNRSVILGLFIVQPVLALGPAALFAALHYRRRQTPVLAATLAWLAYFPYEQAMKLRLLCSGECNIRIDLLLLYPLLGLLSIVAIAAYAKAWIKDRPGEDGRPP